MTELAVLPFDPKNASEEEFAPYAEFRNTMRREILPDDPPVPMEELIQGYKTTPSFVVDGYWVVYNKEKTKIVAVGEASISTADNPHLGDFGIQVLPEYRRQGLAKRLLVPILEFTQRHNRTLLFAFTQDRIPAGEVFMARLGAEAGLKNATNQLKISDLNRDLMRAWLDQAKPLESEFTLEFLRGPYPEEQLAAFTAMLQKLENDQPFDSLQLEEIVFTPEMVREMEENTRARKVERLTYFLIEKATGKFAGFTEVYWNPNRPANLGQGLTGVYPEYRSRGLGRWLKAAMIERALQEFPDVQVVRTGNADSNAHMLKINFDMGFKPYIASMVWQLPVEKVEAYILSGGK